MSENVRNRKGRFAEAISEEERVRIVQLIAGGQSYREVARATGRSLGAIFKLTKKPGNADMIQLEREKTAQKFHTLASKLLDSIKEKDIEKASLGVRVLAACQTIDKMEQLRNKGSRGGGPKIQINILADPSKVQVQGEQGAGELIEIQASPCRRDDE